MALSTLYSAIVLEHNRAPHNFGPLAGATASGSGLNASCGDEVRMALCLDASERIAACGFEGESCAICTAVASILTGLAVGRDRADIAHLRAEFGALLSGAPAEQQRLGALSVFAELVAHPARRACALLPFSALDQALAGAVPLAAR